MEEMSPKIRKRISAEPGVVVRYGIPVIFIIMAVIAALAAMFIFHIWQ